MSPKRAIIAGLAALVVAGALLPDDTAERGASSFATSPEGYGAVFELLGKLGLCRGRSFAPPERLPAEASVWWVEPQGVCDARIAVEGEVDVLDSEAVRWRAVDWIEAGGTAVVFLEPERAGRVACDAIAGIEVPGRVEWEPAGAGEEGRGVVSLRGPATPRARRLELDGLRVFGESLDWRSVLLAAGGRPGDAPFALERDLGRGRLVVVSDARILRNASLDRGDAALLAVDLARAYGAPAFDERAHGFLPETSPVRYLAHSPARPVFLGLVLLGLAFAWRGASWPARRAPDEPAAAPTLEGFLVSLSALYARTRDRARVLERYRELTAARLRRQLGLPPEVPLNALVERLAREGRGSEERLALLRDGRRVESAAALRTAAGELDDLVQEVMR